MTRELQRAIQAMAVECDDTYAMANSIEDMLEEIFDDHEAQIKEVNRVKEDFRKVALDLDAEASELRAQLKAKDEEIERLKAKVYCLENDAIVLNMEQRLIDIALVLEGKLTSKEQQ